MLRRINISNYILIESLDLEIPDGLVIITGETGAGKSILLGAVSLLLGAKADASLLGDKSRNCTVEAEFHLSKSEDIEHLFEEEDMEFSEELILRRVISPSGRSRAFLNDEPVNVRFLSEISPYLIDIHSQHQQLRLADGHFRKQVLDTYAGNASLLARFASGYAEYNRLNSRISEIEAEIREAGKEREWREYQLSELSGARLAPGEIEELENEQKELAHSEETRELLASALSRFSCGDYSFVQELKESIRDLSKVSSHIPRFSEMCDRLESCRIELQDIEDGLAVEADSVKVSPERLEEVESRLSFLWGLMKKHGVSTVEELIERKESFEAALARDESAQSLLDSALSERDALKASLDELSAVLHERRISAASELSPLLQQSVRSLEIPQAVFNIVVSASPERRSTGDDEVDFMFSSSASMAPGDVSKTASGGELSRIMLCIKALLAKYGAMATLVFDEIDTGVSGRAADRMGAMLSGMGRNMQILAITHLPQVAAKGDFHFCVRKEASEGGKTVTTVSRLDGEDKIREIARLLSGSTVGDAAIKNAEELLSEASSAK